VNSSCEPASLMVLPPCAGPAGSPAASPAAGSMADDPDLVDIVTVGIDVGSATTHLLFSRVRLQRLADRLSSRYVVVERTALWSSPVMLTPFGADGLIDAGAVGEFVASAYRSAGVDANGVDSGAVILTGEALRRVNARAIAEKVAADSGRFVCASAGHHLEAVLAAHGSGAVARSRRSPARAGDAPAAIHVDVGGGTAKVAVIRMGEILDTAAVAVGGRLVSYDKDRRVTRLESTIEPLIRRLGLTLQVGQVLPVLDERRLAAALAGVLVDALEGDTSTAREAGLLLQAPSGPLPPGRHLTLSGGVAEYVAAPATATFGDLAAALAEQLTVQLENAGWQVEVLQAPIRATVVGASQFSVQVSGSTIGADEAVLPLRNVPIVHVPMDSANGGGLVDRLAAAVDRRAQGGAGGGREGGAAGGSGAGVPWTAGLPGLHLSWAGDPSYGRLRDVAEAVRQVWESTGGSGPLVVVFDRDVAASFTRVMRSLAGAPPAMVVLDGLELGDLDYLDIGRVMRPAGVVPVVVKSLLFA